MSAVPGIVPLTGGALSPHEAGGKGAMLARLAELGLSQPPGIAVTSAVLDAALGAAGLRELVEAAERLLPESIDTTALAELRAACRELRVPALILEVIESQWRDWGEPQLIVRSSATVEDGAQHSFAGMFESRRADIGDLEEAILAVWDSRLGERAVAYYRIAGLESFPGMAVVVQPFLEATRSGVMFTRFPSPDGDERVLIESVEGDCEKLVLGQVDPERLWWPCHGSEEATSSSDDSVPSGELPLATVRELARVGHTLERALELPQDVEWALCGEELFILQSRPITSRPSGQRPGGGEAPREIGAEVLLTGLGASGGRASGAAHPVFHIHDADALEDGEVLITRMTNPDMVTAMQRSDAVVTDVGGMICHAAIVSRELGIPCVVGTGRATDLVAEGETLTVDGDAGHVYRGSVEGESSESRAALGWGDLWEGWMERAEADDVPLVRSIDALAARPDAISRVLLDPSADLRLDSNLHLVCLDSLDAVDRKGLFADYFRRLARLGIPEIQVLPTQLERHRRELEAMAAEHKGVSIAAPETSGRPLVELPSPDQGDDTDRERGSAEAQVFGTPPAMRSAPMPPVGRRQPYHRYLPKLGAIHAAQVASGDEEFPWIDARPEVVITPLLKSVVLGGMETVPAALGFDDLAPMHVQWIRCRFHFRADTFGPVLERLMQASWDGPFLDDLLRRTRASYDTLEAAAGRLPSSDLERRDIDVGSIRSTLVPWWRAFADFFALSFFIQAQGDDCMAPAIAEIVSAGAGRASESGLLSSFSLPGIAQLTAPTVPVLTAEYMADLVRLNELLRAHGVTTASEALTHEAIAEEVDRHLGRWSWMRERDPYFAPFDTRQAVLEKALRARGGSLPDYDVNADRGRLALAVHLDLAASADEAARLVYAVGANHQLALERENHHIVWLRASYRFRDLMLECERRLGEVTDLLPGDVFFFELPEILSALEALPTPPPAELLQTIHNRRLAYHREARLADEAELSGEPVAEPDYV